ncbi:MAG: BamA/TamA family outer membrane protein [Deltaproteobacteria bacterium]|nr:BamA/TamA family outer membrane protein [Deltaproteobacteria bacterium]
MTATTRRMVSSKARPLEAGRTSHLWRLQSAACFAASAIFCTTALAQSTDREFDPWQGIEEDGRIPKIDKPAELSNPERWRYIPEGRLKPGNVFQRFLVSSFMAPFFFRDSDVGFGGGIAITDLDFRQQRRREFAGLFLSYSVEGQQAYQAVWRRRLHHREAPGGGIFQEERSFLKAWGGYEKSLTRRFYGLGAGTSEGDETSYRDETAFGRIGFELAIPDPGDNLVIGASVKGEWHSLGNGEVSDKPNTGDVPAFSALFARADDHTLGWLELELRYDTRDSQRMPYRGFAVGASIDSALLQSGWDLGSVFAIYGTKVVPIPPLFHGGGDSEEEHPPTDTIAFHLQTRTTAGDLPFYSLPTLGGSRTLRGFIGGRFRDRSMWHASAEYRFWVLTRGFRIPFTKALRVERVGLAFFADTGSVADDWSDLFSSRVWASAGVGLRLTLERDAPFRVDVGFSSEGVEVTAGFGLSF